MLTQKFAIQAQVLSRIVELLMYIFYTNRSERDPHLLSLMYRVAKQCCPDGNRPETPRRPSAGGLRIFWAKSLVIPGIYTKFKLMAHKFCINAWNYQ